MPEEFVIEYHPACLLLPKMADDEFEALRASLRQGYDNKHPIALYDDMILDGRHRYEACKLEGIIPEFEAVDDVDPYEYVRKEHAARRSWKSQEQKALVIGKLIEESGDFQKKLQQIRDDANKARSEAAKVQPRTGTGFAEKQVVPQSVARPEEEGQSPNRISTTKSELLEVNRGAVERAQTIQRKAPALAEKVAAGEMTASAALKEIKKAEQVVVAVDDAYSVIYADPPWELEPGEIDIRGMDEMTVAEVKRVKLPTAENAVVFLWSPPARLRDALDVLKAWGFEYQACVIWDKVKEGVGRWFFARHDLLLVGVKGDMNPDPESRIASVYQEEWDEIVAKPNFFYRMIELMFPDERYLDVFADSEVNDKWSVL